MFRGGFKGGGVVLVCKRMCLFICFSYIRLLCELKGVEIIFFEEKKKYCSF